MASISKIVEVEESPRLLERLTSLELSDKEAKANRKKEKHHRLQLEKKFAKSLDKGKGKGKESVHPTPIDKDVGNVRVFKETPIEEQLNWGTDSAGDDQSDLVRGHPPNPVSLMKSDNPAPTSIPTPYVPPHR